MNEDITYDELHKRIVNRHTELSRQLQRIAAFAVEYPNDIALETVAAIAERLHVQPSSLVRFAKAFDFSGFSEMQRVFRRRLIDGTPDYRERIRSINDAAVKNGDGMTVPLLRAHAEGSIAALRHLVENVDRDRFDRAVEIMAGADTVHLAAQRRSFPVAAYLAYAMSQMGKRNVLLDGAGGMFFQQTRSIRAGDALVAISFRSYSPDVVELVKTANARDIPVLAITDSPLSPLVSDAVVCLEVEEVQVHSFRSLSATMTLALALVVGLGRALEIGAS